MVLLSEFAAPHVDARVVLFALIVCAHHDRRVRPRARAAGNPTRSHACAQGRRRRKGRGAPEHRASIFGDASSAARRHSR